MGSWFRYGAALRNLANTTMRTTRQSLREVLATLLAPLTGGVIVGRTDGSSPGGGRSAPVRPKDRGLNGIKTPERTRPTSAPGYMPRHPTPRTLKPLAVREVDGGVNLRYPPPCYNKSRRMSPNFSKGDRVWVRRQRKNLGDKTCPYWDGPYEVVAKKAHDLYVIQVDQRRLVDVHVDCLMKTVNSPRSPVPLNYTEEVARVPSQFEEDTYNVKKILSHRTYRKRLLFKVRWEGYTKDWDTEEPVETFLPSYNKVWRDYLQKQNLTQTVDILAHLGGPLS